MIGTSGPPYIPPRFLNASLVVKLGVFVISSGELRVSSGPKNSIKGLDGISGKGTPMMPSNKNDNNSNVVLWSYSNLSVCFVFHRWSP